jgi:hypothetical protein
MRLRTLMEMVIRLRELTGRLLVGLIVKILAQVSQKCIPTLLLLSVMVHSLDGLHPPLHLTGNLCLLLGSILGQLSLCYVGLSSFVCYIGAQDLQNSLVKPPTNRRFHTSNSRLQHQHSSAPEFFLINKKKLIIDIPIQWNSVYLMLQCTYEFRDVCLLISLFQMLIIITKVINALCWNNPIYQKYKLAESDWSVIKCLLEWLKV